MFFSKTKLLKALSDVLSSKEKVEGGRLEGNLGERRYSSSLPTHFIFRGTLYS